MNGKKIMALLLTASVIAGAAFATGVEEDNDGYRRGSDRDRGGYSGERHEQMWQELQENAEEYSGTLSLESGSFPALETSDGTYFLMIRFPLDEEEIPADGAVMTVSAVEAPGPRGGVWSGDATYLMVLSAEADGMVITAPEPGDWPEGTGPRGSRGDRGGAGGRGGRSGHGGMMGDDRGWDPDDTWKNQVVPESE